MKTGDTEKFRRDNDKLVVVQWKDSKEIALPSVSTGCEAVQNVRRWSKTEEKYVTVPYPCTCSRNDLRVCVVNVCN
jgi:hypothetical protein